MATAPPPPKKKDKPNPARVEADTAAENPRAVVGGNRLASFIERVERLQEEKAGIQSDIKDVFAEAKGEGFDVKAIRTIIAMRKRDPDERREEESILEVYMQALGMI